MVSVIAVIATPGSRSPIMLTILSAHSAVSSTEGCLRYSRRSVSAAFFLTNVEDVLPSVRCPNLRRARERREKSCPAAPIADADSLANHGSVDRIAQRLGHLLPSQVGDGVQR